MKRTPKPTIPAPVGLLKLMEYARTGSEFDPPEVATNKKQLLATMTNLGESIIQGKPFSLDFTGAITVEADETGKLAIRMTHDDMLIGQIAEALVALNGHLSSSFKLCKEEECDIYFFSDNANQMYCGPECAKRAAYKAIRDKKRRTKVVDPEPDSGGAADF